MAMEDGIIGEYAEAPAACHPYDARAPAVARRVGELIRRRVPGVSVEHVGSTAVPGCAGKGVIDLLVAYGGAEELRAIKDALAALGFQRQRTRNPFPEERPMRTGALAHDGTLFRLHVHVVPAGSPEVGALRAFRDRLRGDAALVAAYVARKEEIVAGGVGDPIDHSIAKGTFVEAHLDRPAAGGRGGGEGG